MHLADALRATVSLALIESGESCSTRDTVLDAEL